MVDFISYYAISSKAVAPGPLAMPLQDHKGYYHSSLIPFKYTSLSTLVIFNQFISFTCQGHSRVIAVLLLNQLNTSYIMA